MIEINAEILRKVREYLENEFDARPTLAQLEDIIDFFDELITGEK